jgi:hypothetical protein
MLGLRQGNRQSLPSTGNGVKALYRLPPQQYIIQRRLGS